MIRTVITCDYRGCRVIYCPDWDANDDVLERAARAVGWVRLTAMSHACPDCAAEGATRAGRR
ncbi:hypothetical protein [Streptomyces uncialis]|uniref:hypothetical protein n=1 Tax=Streptomyces uncialis TaxID=1048205 RepID=UPI0022579927|nr:hypothetical protein [Streptomyces uncialis]MCX4665034.1 hypothetical protein [Streptomyces uncialis]